MDAKNTFTGIEKVGQDLEPLRAIRGGSASWQKGARRVREGSGDLGNGRGPPEGDRVSRREILRGVWHLGEAGGLARGTGV